jgi:hypothetical protein
MRLFGVAKDLHPIELAGTMGASTIALGAHPITATGALSFFVAKFDPSGMPVFGKAFGNGGSVTGESGAVEPAVAMDAEGAVIVAGYGPNRLWRGSPSRVAWRYGKRHRRVRG